LNLRSFLAAVSLTTLMLALTLAPPSGSQLQRQYDPWADINDDGKIDAKDIGYTCTLFGKTGDPAKPVIISHKWAEWNVIADLNPGQIFTFKNLTGGYERFTILVGGRPNLLQRLAMTGSISS